MYRDPQSHHHNGPSDYGHGSHSKSRSYNSHFDVQAYYHSTPSRDQGMIKTSSYTDDTDLDRLFTKNGCDRLQGTSQKIHNVSSDYHSTQSKHHDKRRAANYMDNLGSYYHSTRAESHGKRDARQHFADVGSDCQHASNEKYIKGSVHHHLIDKGPDHSRPPYKSYNNGGKHHTDGRQAPHAKPHQKRVLGKKELRERLFQQALKPFNKYTGTPYNCSQTDIDFHQKNTFPTKNPGPFVTSREATKELMWQNDINRSISPREETAIKNLLSAASRAHDGLALGPDLAIKAFADLDTVFFAGRLRDHVSVRWRPDLRFSTTRAWGVCSVRQGERKRGQCRIELNASLIFREAWTARTKDPFESMIGTLLHEMCHAYEFVRSPHDVEPGDGHGKLFGTRIAVVHKRAVSILGLWAIEHGERHRQHHFFMPGCLVGQVDHVDGGRDEGDGVVGEVGNGRRGKRGEGGNWKQADKVQSGKKGSKAGGNKAKSEWKRKGAGCVLM